ncbi:MAG TPA: diaminopimelate epimerase [Aliidongia sp.]|nr:diaminopimelate epimerase [Aliidongia sp.]
MSAIPFRKMHGLGNDFVVLDTRSRTLGIDAAAAKAIADRHTGIGCDQLIILEPAHSAAADFFMRILNADGSEAGACGNATRCVADLVMDEAGTGTITVETISGLLPSRRGADGLVTVDMGPALTDWRQIPLSHEADTRRVSTGVPELPEACCTSMGNPHASFFVPDADAIDLARLGPRLEHHPLFPERANIGVASLLGPDRLRLRVWERGAGLTLACGSGACAALVAAARLGLTGRRAEIVMECGALTIEWAADGHVLMTGPVATSFTGTIDLALAS